MYGLLGLLILVLDIIAIFSVLAGVGTVGHKVLWTLLILIFPVLGVLTYFLLGRSLADARL